MEEQAHEKADFSGFWEGFYYLSFFIFSCLFVMPLFFKKGIDASFSTQGILFALGGVLAGIGVYRVVRNRPGWLKLIIILVVYACIIYQLVTHVDRFTNPA